jgi:hypothetical protein
MAIDQLHRLLSLVGRRHLHEDARLDADGAPRLIFQTPEWDDFVQLAVSEIHLYGASNFQVSRRLHAVIENLLVSLPENRYPALRRELDLLDRALPKLHEFAEDLDLARKADFQGLGGSSKRYRGACFGASAAEDICGLTLQRAQEGRHPDARLPRLVGAQGSGAGQGDGRPE